MPDFCPASNLFPVERTLCHRLWGGIPGAEWPFCGRIVATKVAMSLFVLRKIVILAMTLAAASLLIFLVLDVLPGNAAQVMLGADASQEAVAALTHKLGLDRGPLERFALWLYGMSRGDFGVSLAYGTPILDLVRDRLSVTVPLALMAMVLTVSLALMLGIFAAARHNQPADFMISVISQLGIAVPNFWCAILLILVFSLNLRWFPAGGFPNWGAGLWPALQALVLPSIALALGQAAILTRVTRSALLDVLGEDFIRTARAKGLSQNAVMWRHALRNALIPIVTLMGLQFTNLVAGTVVIENVFYLPGLGRLVFQSIANRDLTVVRTVVMLLVAFVVIVNFLIDILYGIIDPRLRESQS
jgi:peptide/nickel transport system permease protein